MIGTIIIFVLILIISCLVGILIASYIDRPKTKPKEKRHPEIKKAYVQNKYGLYFNPVETLNEMLPEPPNNHLWEIQVVSNDEGEYGLSLGLYDMIKDTVSSKNVYSLSMCYNDPEDTDDIRYVTDAQIHLLAKGYSHATVNEKIINMALTPLVEWAQDLIPKALPEKKLDELDYLLSTGVAKQQKVV